MYDAEFVQADAERGSSCGLWHPPRAKDSGNPGGRQNQVRQIKERGGFRRYPSGSQSCNEGGNSNN